MTFWGKIIAFIYVLMMKASIVPTDFNMIDLKCSLLIFINA